MTALLSASLLGCATPGRAYDDTKVAQIQKGITTEAQLVAWFGSPVSRMMGPDGSKAMTWRFSSGKGQVTKPSGKLEVRLDSDGKVTTYSAAAGK